MFVCGSQAAAKISRLLPRKLTARAVRAIAMPATPRALLVHIATRGLWTRPGIMTCPLCSNHGHNIEHHRTSINHHEQPASARVIALTKPPDNPKCIFFLKRLASQSVSMKKCSRTSEMVQYRRHCVAACEQAQGGSDRFQK
jgi:hypothetical protein